MESSALASRQSAGYAERMLANFKEALLPLKPLFDDGTVTDIMVNCPNEVYLRKRGSDERFPVDLPAQRIRTAITFLASMADKTIGTDRHVLSARFPGFRVEAALPPVSVRGPSMCIRRHATKVLTLADYQSSGTITPEQAALIQQLVDARKNFLIAGGTFSGKTTLMNCVLSLIQPGHRLYVIEQVQELRVVSPNHVLMECDPDHGVSARDLVKVAMRYNPDRIILGELRDGAAYDWLDASNTGHPGSGATIHADGAFDALARLESLVMMADTGIPHHVIQERIGSTVDVVLFIRQAAGVRRLSEICLVDGFDRSKGTYVTTTTNHGESL